MQNLEVWIIQDVLNLEGSQSCESDPYNSICSKILAAEQSAQITYNVEAFALPGRHESITPIVEYWKLKRLPALVFYNPDLGLSFYALDGNRITENRIKKVLELAESFTWSNEAGGYVNADGESINITESIDKKLGGLMGADWGLPIGGMWGGCKSYLPESLEKICDIPIWVYFLLAFIILILLIKIIN